MTEAPADDGDEFSIPQQPYREFTPDGRATMHDAVRFVLRPTEPIDSLSKPVRRVLESPRYTSIPWHGLPYPVLLVHDERTSSTFRVIILDDRLAFDVLPQTTEAGLNGLYQAIAQHTGLAWSIERRE